MKTAILTVGTEILFGQIVNTNAAFLSKELQNMGYDVMYHYSVGDKSLEHLLSTTATLYSLQGDWDRPRTT